MAVLKIVIQKGPREGETIEYNPTRTKVVRIGRVVKGNNLPIKDPGISSKHMKIEFNSSSGKWVVFDLGSSNGTVVGEAQLGHDCFFELSHGDEIKVGETSVIRVEIVGEVGEVGGGRRRKGRGILGNVEENDGGVGKKDEFEEKCSLGKFEGKGGFGECSDFEDKGSLGIVEENDGIVEKKGTFGKNDGFEEKGGFGLGDDVEKEGNFGKNGGFVEKGSLGDLEGRGRGRGRGRPRKNVEKERENGEDGEWSLIGVRGRGRGRGEVGVRRTRSSKRGEGDADDVFVSLEDVVPVRKTRSGKNVMVEKAEVDGGEGAVVDSKKTRRGRGRKKKVEVEEGLSQLGVGDVSEQIEEVGVEEGVAKVGVRDVNNEVEVEGDAMDCLQTKENVVDDVVQASKKVVGEESEEVVADTVQENAVVVGDKLESEDVVMEDRVVEESEIGEEDEEELAGEEDGREGDEVPVPDLEKMTLGEWFDYLEVLLPQQIYAERDKVIADMRKKAKQFDEYVLQQLNEKAKRAEGN